MNTYLNYNSFIFEKENSINEILIDDIIELYKIECKKDNFCDYIIMYDDNFTKFKMFLLNEIKTSLFLYIIQLTEKTKNVELQKYFRDALNNVSDNVSEFTISTKTFKNKDIEVINEKKITKCYDKRYSNKINILRFIWFMNNYDGEIIFPNGRKIIPKKGKLVIFPLSWHFPYEEINNKSSEIIIITGFFYKTQ